MAKGNSIIVSADPKGHREGGIIDDTSLPGTIMQVEAATEPVGGRHKWIAAAPGGDGIPVMCAVLLEDSKQGKLVSDAYVAGRHGELYWPLPGEDVNVRVGETAGTANSFAIGDRLCINATGGYLIPDTGTDYSATLFIVMETVTQVAADSLVWCKKL